MLEYQRGMRDATNSATSILFHEALKEKGVIQPTLLRRCCCESLLMKQIDTKPLSSGVNILQLLGTRLCSTQARCIDVLACRPEAA